LIEKKTHEKLTDWNLKWKCLLQRVCCSYMGVYLCSDVNYEKRWFLSTWRGVEGEAYINSYHDPDFLSLNSTGVYHDRRYHSCRSAFCSCRWL